MSGLSLVVDNAEEHIGNPEFQQDAIRTIKNTLAKMRNLMQRLKAIPEKTMLNARAENLDRLAGETVAELAKLGLGKRILYRGAPSYACVDKEEIKKVVVNLVQNALEASGDEGMVTLETRSNNGSACICVSDTGCGMPENFLRNDLFKAFRTTKEKGLGIGLYQCKQIVETHGGRLEVQSEAGKGSVFTVVLPSSKPGT
jgi:putative PEP-CTERM system histidine kinase